MTVDERRRDEARAGIDFDARLCDDRAFDRDNAAVARGDVDSAAPVGQARAADDQVESPQAP